MASSVIPPRNLISKPHAQPFFPGRARTPTLAALVEHSTLCAHARIFIPLKLSASAKPYHPRCQMAVAHSIDEVCRNIPGTCGMCHTINKLLFCSVLICYVLFCSVSSFSRIQFCYLQFCSVLFGLFCLMYSGLFLNTWLLFPSFIHLWRVSLPVRLSPGIYII